MDKIALNAVAGAGKTTLIINSLNLIDRFAIITYTTANQESIRQSIIRKFGYLPSNIYVFGYFEFIYSFCYMPIQNTFPNEGLSFENPSYWNRSLLTSDGRFYSNKLAQHIMESKLSYIERINKYFDHLFIDEMQDFGSFDLDWMLSLSKTDISITLVGDFFQTTFLTSRKGNKNASIHSDYNRYKSEFIKVGFAFDETTLVTSRRCSRNICNFISERLLINIDSSRQDDDNTNVAFLSDKEQIAEVFNNDLIKKLFYDNHRTFKCNSDNWGASKGLTFDDVCVVLNPKTAKLYKNNELKNLAPKTLSKFYVACTRARGNLYFVEQSKLPKDSKK